MDGVNRALAEKKTKLKEDLYLAVNFPWQKLSEYYAEVTPMTVILLISAHILELLLKLWSFRKWNKGMDIYPEGEAS